MPVSSLSPFIVAEHFHECGQPMRREIKRWSNGKIQSMLFFCDICKQGFEESLIHAMGTHAKYEAPLLVGDEPAKPKAAKEPVVLKVQ
jgi:hypothetical protein